MKRIPKIKTTFIIWEKETHNNVPRDEEVRSRKLQFNTTKAKSSIRTSKKSSNKKRHKRNNQTNTNRKSIPRLLFRSNYSYRKNSKHRADRTKNPKNRERNRMVRI